MKAHPYAELFPMMTAAELDALAADIGENGLRHPVVLYGGKVLDGRNRLLACERAGVEPAFTEHVGDDASALALVISLNAQRRDLTAGQRAIVAARALDVMPERRGRPGKDGGSHHVNGLSRESVAKVFKVGAQSVQQAKALLSDAPDLAEQVESCTSSLAAAYEQLQNRRKETARKEKDAERLAEFKDAVSAGDMTWEEALQKIVEREREEKERAAHEADARRLWFADLARFVRWVQESVATRSDEHLAWYSEGAPAGDGPEVTSEDLAGAVGHLKRVLACTFQRRKHVQN